MRKFICFCKLPLAIISGIVFATFLIFLIVLMSIPRTNKYTYKYEFFGASLEINMTFKSGSKGTLEMIYSSYKDERETITFDYVIIKGVLYVVDYDDKLEEVGKIDAFTIEFDSSMAGDFSELFDEIVLKCHWAIAMRDVSITMIVIGALLGITSAVIFVLDRKRAISNKTQIQLQDK